MTKTNDNARYVECPISPGFQMYSMYKYFDNIRSSNVIPGQCNAARLFSDPLGHYT